MTREQQIEAAAKELSKILCYNSNEGLLYSVKTMKPYKKIDSHGYVYFHALGRKWKAHRVIWFFEKGYFPPMIDHIDGDKTNNKIQNLREVTPRQNSYNCEIKSNISKYKGVWKSKSGRYRASLTEHGKRTHLGYYNTAEEAAEVYNKALAKADPQARHNRLEKSAEVKTLEQLLAKQKEALKVYEAALEKIEDPRKRDHREPDKYTEVGCMMNMATEALSEGRKIIKENK